MPDITPAEARHLDHAAKRAVRAALDHFGYTISEDSFGLRVSGLRVDGVAVEFHVQVSDCEPA